MSARRYQLNAANTFAAVLVFNDDSRLLSRLGHDHVVRATEFNTTLSIDPEELETLTFSLSFAVKDMVVDDDEDRRRANLDGPVSEKDRAATRDNMLARNQLDAKKHPAIAFQVNGARRAPTGDFDWLLNATFVVLQHRHTFSFPVSVELDGLLKIRGKAELSHRDLGLKPYKAPMGALQNKEALHFIVQIDAAPL